MSMSDSDPLSVDPGPVLAGEAQLAEAAVAALFDLPLAFGAEGIRFLGRRYQAQAEHMGRLLACRSMPELAAEQMRYLAGAAYDCCDEAGALITRAQATLAPVVPLPLAD
jgi:hypothetical protein